MPKELMWMSKFVQSGHKLLSILTMKVSFALYLLVLSVGCLPQDLGDQSGPSIRRKARRLPTVKWDSRNGNQCHCSFWPWVFFIRKSTADTLGPSCLCTPYWRTGVLLLRLHAGGPTPTHPFHLGPGIRPWSCHVLPALWQNQCLINLFILLYYSWQSSLVLIINTSFS